MSLCALRRAAASDAHSLQRTCLGDRSLAQVEERLRWCLSEREKGRLVCLVAEVNGQTVAIGQLAIRQDEGEIGSLIVAPAYRRQGIGTALVQALIEQAQQQRLHSLEITANVTRPWIRAWYERLGFTYLCEHDFPDERVAILTMDLAQGDQTLPTHASP
jgi:ribosomal protein S18 acetylase RimI-like enzyme